MLPAPMSLTLWMRCEIPVLLAKATPAQVSPVPNWSSQTDPSSFDLLAFHSPCSRLASSTNSSTQTILVHVTSDFYFFKNISPFSGLHLCHRQSILSMAPKGILSVLLSDHDTVGHTSHVTNNPWFRVSFGVIIKALPVVQETVDRCLDLPTPRNARSVLCVPCGLPFCFSNIHIYQNQAFVLPSSSFLPQVCETLPHQPELPQAFRLKCLTLSCSPFPMPPAFVSQWCSPQPYTGYSSPNLVVAHSCILNAEQSLASNSCPRRSMNKHSH